MSFYSRPAEKFPPAIKNLIIINVLVWLAQMLFDAKIDLTGKIGLWPFLSNNFRPWQIVTHMFAHAASGQYMFFHILFNMFALWMFGRVLENLWGSKRFLIFYMICGLGSAVVHLTMQYIMGGHEMAVGASGAVFGVLVAFAMTFPNTELYLMFVPIPIKAKWAILGLIAIDLFGGVTRSGSDIAHFAHLGGALTGFILLKIWNKNNRRTLY
ncbi:rhomboid family intramembrane serine protease [Niabella ginsengisoli]|uniref:Rhomboid family intramembrane serine protease n=1 Tax=Niabella ginsengisoli TaxID=522298 RepID=A0ABS9SMM0_9BACT|nr:rhomboid family intramembrane serine protease [Niabella ginsengisoli]MCH5599633.1 rhomboid family intramembrane serine protease [Niabella ginsengisoli]